MIRVPVQPDLLRWARERAGRSREGRTGFTEAFGMLGVKKMDTFNELGRKLGVGY